MVVDIMVILPFVYHTPEIFRWVLISFIITLLGFKAIVEWRFLKESNDYIATGILLIVSVFVVYNLNYLLSIGG